MPDGSIFVHVCADDDWIGEIRPTTSTYRQRMYIERRKLLASVLQGIKPKLAYLNYVHLYQPEGVSRPLTTFICNTLGPGWAAVEHENPASVLHYFDPNDEDNMVIACGTCRSSDAKPILADAREQGIKIIKLDIAWQANRNGRK